MGHTMTFSGLGLHLGNLSRLSNAVSRSISPENFTGEKGKGGMALDGPAARQARDLGQGWKISPYVVIEPGATFTLADIAGQGAIQQIWMTISRGRLRHTILRIYWDDQAQPSVECPIDPESIFINGFAFNLWTLTAWPVKKTVSGCRGSSRCQRKGLVPTAINRFCSAIQDLFAEGSHFH